MPLKGAGGQCTSSCGNRRKCLNLKHLVIVPTRLIEAASVLWKRLAKMVLDSLNLLRLASRVYIAGQIPHVHTDS